MPFDSILDLLCSGMLHKNKDCIFVKICRLTNIFIFSVGKNEDVFWNMQTIPIIDYLPQKLLLFDSILNEACHDTLGFYKDCAVVKIC
jgi:hypothetical protein